MPHTPVSKIITRFRVQSCADGTMKVTPTFKRGYGKPGVLTRMYLAGRIQDRLNGTRMR